MTKALILAALAVFLVQGCASVNWSADRVANGVNAYCDRFTSLEREVMRARVNLQTDPDRIRIYCSEDRPRD